MDPIYLIVVGVPMLLSMFVSSQLKINSNIIQKYI